MDADILPQSCPAWNNAAVWNNHGTRGSHGRKRPGCGLFLAAKGAKDPKMLESGESAVGRACGRNFAPTNHQPSPTPLRPRREKHTLCDFCVLCGPKPPPISMTSTHSRRRARRVSFRRARGGRGPCANFIFRAFRVFRGNFRKYSAAPPVPTVDRRAGDSVYCRALTLIGSFERGGRRLRTLRVFRLAPPRESPPPVRGWQGFRGVVSGAGIRRAVIFTDGLACSRYRLDGWQSGSKTKGGFK